MLFGISQRRCLFIILAFDRHFFLGANRLHIFLDLFHIQRPSHRVDARPRACFVHDIDGLVRQETASNISIGKPNGCFQRLVGKLGFVMCLVLRAQAFQNLNRFFERWRFDLNCLESAFERCIFFDVLAVLIEGGGSNALQFAPAEPAPTIMCSSSMKRMTFFERRISSITALIRSSNWPRYFVPATMSARSSVMTRLSRNNFGMLPTAVS